MSWSNEGIDCGGRREIDGLRARCSAGVRHHSRHFVGHSSTIRKRWIKQKMNLRPNALALSIFSDRMLRIGIYLPFVAVIAFALLGLYTQSFPGFASSQVSVPSLSFLQDQRAFLLAKGLVRGLNVDFVVFEAFIWVASIVGLLRFLTGVFSPQVLNSFRGKLEAYGKQGRSPVGILVFYLFFFRSELLAPSILNLPRIQIWCSPSWNTRLEVFYV
jgi:hypothetical protein